jgi:hypothetical protein
MLPEKKSTPRSPKFNDRVSGAERSARELSARVEAFLAELAKPPDPPPWSPPPDTAPEGGEEVERLRALLHGSQRHAIVAENRAEVAEEQVAGLTAFCRRLERLVKSSEAWAEEAERRARRAEASLADVTEELGRLHACMAANEPPDIVQRAVHAGSGANDSPQQRQARLHLDDLLYPAE